MPQVILYTSAICPFCVRSKELLRRKGIEFTEIRVDENPKLRDEMIAKSKRQTVPQIFIKERYIGGFDELYALERQGKLDQLLNEEHNND